MWKIMIADDEPFIRDGLSQLIPWKDMDCELVCTAENGSELVERMEEGHPDIVITDIRMPKMDGLQVAEYISENCPEIKVIILSAYSEFDYAKQAIRFNVSDYVLKSSVLEDLPMAIEKAKQQLEKQQKELLETSENESSEELSENDSLYHKMLKYVEENYTRKITLDEMAKELHANRSYLSRLYKSKRGVNLFDDIIQKRVEKAKYYLLHTNKKIYEISEETGFEDTAYFSRVFKRQTGMSPREYGEGSHAHEETDK